MGINNRKNRKHKVKHGKINKAKQPDMALYLQNLDKMFRRAGIHSNMGKVSEKQAFGKRFMDALRRNKS